MSLRSTKGHEMIEKAGPLWFLRWAAELSRHQHRYTDVAHGMAQKYRVLPFCADEGNLILRIGFW